jgi:uncharacterized YigZ family protein
VTIPAQSVAKPAPVTALHDHFRTLADRGESQIKVQRSLFLGIALPSSTDEDFFARLAGIQKQYFDATHHCWAFRLFAVGEGRARSSDAGEPGGSAGRPILSAIEAADLWDVGVIVVRYFGGVKLGTGGLGRAYREAAAAALAGTIVRDRYLYARFTVAVPHVSISSAYRLIDAPAVVLVHERYGETNEFAFDVRRSLADAFAEDLRAKRLEFERS